MIQFFFGAISSYPLLLLTPSPAITVRPLSSTCCGVTVSIWARIPTIKKLQVLNAEVFLNILNDNQLLTKSYNPEMYTFNDVVRLSDGN